jgi:hypothetical protein
VPATTNEGVESLAQVLLGKPAFRGLAVAVSIVTKTGDDGSTALMYGRRVPKNHPRVETYGTVDELNAALGSGARDRQR